MVLPILASLAWFLIIESDEFGLPVFVFAMAAFIYMTEAAKIKLSFFACIGVGGIYLIHSIIIFGTRSLWNIWPVLTAIFTAVLAGIYWILDGRKFGQIYKNPLKYAGLTLMAIPLIGACTEYTQEFLFSSTPNLPSILIFTTVVVLATIVYFVEANRKRQALFTYISTIGVYAIHFLLIQIIFPNNYLNIWPPITAAFTAALAVIHWQLYTRKIGAEFQDPYGVAGLGLMAIPILVSLTPWNFSEWNSVITLSIATVVYMVEARIKKSLRFGYLGIGFIVVTIWSVLATLGVEEMQAYIFPLGFALVGIGWYQRARVNDQFYQPITIIALGVFFVSSFYQSRGDQSLMLFKGMVDQHAGDIDTHQDRQIDDDDMYIDRA